MSYKSLKIQTLLIRLNILIIKSLISGISKRIHPMDSITILTDIQNKNGSGFQNLLNSIRNKKDTYRLNFDSYIHSESMRVFKKEYPMFFEKYIFEWVVLLSEGVETNTKKKEQVKISFIIFILIRWIFKLMYNSYLYTTAHLGSKADSALQWFSLSYKSIVQSDMMEVGASYHVLKRINFMYRKMNEFDIVNNYFSTFINFFLILNITSLPNFFNLRSSSIEDEELLKLFQFIGSTTYEEYSKGVFENKEKYLTPNKLFLHKLELENTPIISLDTLDKESNYKGAFFVLNRGLSLKFFYKIRDKLGKDKFGIFIESYCEKFTQFQLSKYAKKKFKRRYDYSSGFSYKKGDSDIDFYILNKEKGTVIFFEIKFKNELNEDLKRNNLTKLCSKGGEIFKGVSQLKKHNERLDLISKRLGIKITSIHNVFINYSKSMSWNFLVRELLEEQDPSFSDIKYTFMSLQEFEYFMHICCLDGKDFFQVLENKFYYQCDPHIGFASIYKAGSGKFNIETINNIKKGYIEDDMRQYLMGIVDKPLGKYLPFRKIDFNLGKD